jgi:group I intron endonuclease
MEGIYKITSPTGRIYIGQSIDVEKRRRMYVKNHCIKQTKLYASLVKYGFDKHLFEVIEECVWGLLNEREEYWIEFYNTFNSDSGMNLSSGGLNKRVSEETKKKISIGNSRKKRPDLSLMNRTQKRIPSKETIAKGLESRKGFKHSEESKIIMRNKALLRPLVSEETKALMSKNRKGIKPTEEMKKGILLARLNSEKTGKTVVNINTNEEYKNLTYLCNLKGYVYGTMKKKMRGDSKNNTDYKYK